MKKLLMLCFLFYSLQAVAGVDRNFVGQGTWSSAYGSGNLKSHIHLGWNSGIAFDYRIDFADGKDELHLQMIVQPFGDGSCTVLNMKKKLVGTCREDTTDENTLVISYKQDKATIELTMMVAELGEGIIGITSAKKTAADGSTITWQDQLVEVE